MTKKLTTCNSWLLNCIH